MKKTIIFLHFFLLSVCFLSKAMAEDTSGFIHPGILHTDADFDRIREKVNSKSQPWLQGWEKLISNSHAQLNYTPHPTVKLIRGGGSREEPEGDNYGNAMNDASAAYQCAIRWKITGDNRYADKSIEILNAWAKTCIGIYGNSNISLASGIYGFSFVNAAEIMRTYSGWAQNDFERFKKFIFDVFYSASSDFMYRRHGTCDSHYWSNWGLCNGVNIIAVGIFLDDEFIFNEGMYYFKYSKQSGREFNEDIENLVWYLHTPTLGQWQESNRDQGHSLMGIGLAGDLAEIAWNQGEDLYAYKNNRLLAGFEYVAKYNLGYDVPNVRYVNCTNDQPSIGDGGRGAGRPIWEKVYNHYEKRKGIDVPYSKMYADRSRPEGGGGDYGGNSGGFDNLGYGTLLNTLDATYKADCPDTYLTPSIQINQNAPVEKSGIAANPGDKITMKAIIPESEEGGTWLWSTGETSREIAIDNIQKGNMYRVTYTNKCGTKSTQSFCISVYGDCLPSKINPLLYYNNIWHNTSNLTVKKGSAVLLEFQPKQGTWEYWVEGKKMTTDRIIVNETVVINVKYTNPGGAVSTMDVTLTIPEIIPYLNINDGSKLEASEAFVVPGTNVTLNPSGNNALSWLWNTGETSRFLPMYNLQNDAERTVTLTQNSGKVSSLTYYIGVYAKNVLREGTYNIIDRLTGLYLTNQGTGTKTPLFQEKIDDEDNKTQLWNISNDRNRYKIVSAHDNRYINENCEFGTNPYYADWNTMELYTTGKLCVAIQNAEKSGTKYWIIKNNIVTGKGLDDPGYPSDFPFLFWSQSATSLPKIVNNSTIVYYNYPSIIFDLVDESPVFVELYSIMGVRIASGKLSESNNKLDVGALPAGVYIIKMNERGFITSKKIIIK